MSTKFFAMALKTEVKKSNSTNGSKPTTNSSNKKINPIKITMNVPKPTFTYFGGMFHGSN